MSRTLAIATAILTILHSYVSAQAPSCFPGYEWSFNSLHQSPCTMSVALGGACDGGFSLDPLGPGDMYLGPITLYADSCQCSTVFYSLLSACSYCQNQSYIDWSFFSLNCTNVYNQVFLYPIPQAIVVPHYAYLDVMTDNTFNVIAAESAGGPESSPVPQATSTGPIVTSTSVAAPSKKLDVGAITGGVIGGVAVIGIVACLIAFTFIRCRKPSVSTPSTNTAYASPQTMMRDVKYNSTVPTMASGKTYESNDSNMPNPFDYSTQSGSPQRVSPTIARNFIFTTPGVQVPARTQYTGAPEPQLHS